MTPERARHLTGLARFLASLSPLPHVPATLSATPAGTTALALRSDDDLAVWLLAPESGYGAPVDHARVAIPDLVPGKWRVRFVDELSGNTLHERVVSVAARPLVLEVPRFVRHIALHITREHPRRD
jgi:hypothetical protein